jgi:carboxylesterase
VPELLEGAEPFSAPGGPDGALVLHGFTGSPHSIRGLARALAATGLAVEAPLLPGHGTTIEDMLASRWDDWRAGVEAAYVHLAGRCRRVVLAGLSMGGSLSAALAADHPEVAGMVVVNPYIDPPASSFQDILRGLLAEGETVIPSHLGSDIADGEAKEVGYSGTPIAPLLSLCEGLDGLFPRLPDITCPVLIMTSASDHVVPPVSSEVLAEHVSGPVERVRLENSFHVATLDHDREAIERRAVDFVRKVLGG